MNENSSGKSSATFKYDMEKVEDVNKVPQDDEQKGRRNVCKRKPMGFNLQLQDQMRRGR